MNMANNIIISDELLAAFLDGNTSEEETNAILQAMKTDKSLRETLDIALKADPCIATSDVAEAAHSISLRQETFDELPMLKLAAESSENICSVLCEAYVLHRRNVSFDRDSLISTARDNHWLKAEGVPLHAIGQLLALNGLIVSRKYDGSLEYIAEALSKDDDVIVAVDCDKLYSNLPDEENAANHAVVVTAVDSKAGAVTIYDPLHDRHLTVVSHQFEQAWRESGYYMVCVLRSVEEYNPQPICLDNIPLTDNLLELREAIAENAHDVWAAARIKDGWTYGTVRDDEKKKHPDLIPYSALPDSEKEYDRIMAFDTIRLVKKLGFDIVKR